MKLFRYLFVLTGFLLSVAHSQFHVDTIAQAPAISFPVALAFPPDGSNRLFFTEKSSGKVRIISNDTLLPEPFVTVSVKSYGEQGLLGLTFHPGYPDTPFVYIYYTRAGDSANVLVRYTDSSGTGINPEILLTVSRQLNSSSHNGGNLHFGPDHKLYVSIGDYYFSMNAQDTAKANKRGKIHRFNDDGTIPADNPYPGNSLYVYGCRNSFDFQFDKLTGKLYASENGPGCNDEINFIEAGGNYGWPRDGYCEYSNSGVYKNPMYHWSLPPSVTGIMVYRDSVIPNLYGKLLVSSYNFGKIFSFGLNGTGDSVTSDPTNLLMLGSSIIDIETGPDGYIYMANSTFGGISRILRLRPAINIPPQPQLQYPTANAFNLPPQFTLRWRQSAESEYYDLQVAFDSGFTSLVLDTTTRVDTLMYIHNLDYTTTYYWRVRARNDIGISSYSSLRSFTVTNPAPAAPFAELPQDSALNQPVVLTFQWHPAPTAVSYTLQIAGNPAFTPILYTDSLITDTVKTVGTFVTATKYYWRLNARNTGGSSSFSPIRMFTTVPPAPGAITLNSPPDKSVEQSVSVTLQWDSVAYGESFHVQLSFDSSMTDLIVDDSSVIGITEMVNSLAFGSKYYWRVRGKNISGYGQWSAVWSFFTEQKYYQVSKNWNLISLPLEATAKTKAELFPTSVSNAFGFVPGAGYSMFDTLEQGKGYWLKFDSLALLSLPGYSLHLDTLEMVEGWNLIGSISDTIPTASISSVPPEITTSGYFGFENSYVEKNEIIPGRGYWVKVSSDGILILSAIVRKNKLESSISTSNK